MLGQRLLQLRNRRELSQGELAARVGSTAATISKYERGAYEPRLEMLGRLAEALGSTTDFLITGGGPASEVEAFVPRLEGLPQELRSGVLEFLDRMLKVHEITLQRKPKKRKSPE
ncbi:MAG: hypothetical protein QOH06_5159 [Acidobacteriota bacterium]|jgi:transcriptional regulator with XRE-family HTH domain|nr:hypothetical protein [Acidobacteriota bacterium]